MRIIVHLDLDAFFCSAEILKNPSLEGLPIVVGGKPEQRGVIAAASYPARKFGIHSAMPMAQAKKLCPELVIIKPHFALYKTYSRIVMGLIKTESPTVQQVSVDEAYFDLTQRVTQWDEGIPIAKKLQLRISRDVGLSSSIGIASNKMVAKIASDFEKPAGFTVVNPGEEQGFLDPLHVNLIPGIGPKTSEKLQNLGINTISQLRKVPEAQLRYNFGKMGMEMHHWANGIDDRPVVEEREIKSVSHERTFAKDLFQQDEMIDVLIKLCQLVADRLSEKQFKAKTVTLKIRYSDFFTVTRQYSFTEYTDSFDDISRIVNMLFIRHWQSRKGVRLLGVGCSKLSHSDGQLAIPL